MLFLGPDLRPAGLPLTELEKALNRSSRKARVSVLPCTSPSFAAATQAQRLARCLSVTPSSKNIRLVVYLFSGSLGAWRDPPRGKWSEAWDAWAAIWKLHLGWGRENAILASITESIAHMQATAEAQGAQFLVLLDGSPVTTPSIRPLPSWLAPRVVVFQDKLLLRLLAQNIPFASASTLKVLFDDPQKTSISDGIQFTEGAAVLFGQVTAASLGRSLELAITH